jgi:hypothetical protein
MAMKLFAGLVMSAGLILTASAANAQILAPYEFSRSFAVSDFDSPYAAQEIPAPRYWPSLLPPQEVYALLRDNGFSPIGVLQQRGPIYTIAVIDPNGDDGRLVIDARTGRILRFMPAYRMGGNPNGDARVAYGAVGPQSINPARSEPRPPASIPRVASRTMPAPKAPPPYGAEVKPLAARPAPAQAAAVQAKPVEARAAPQAAAPAIVEAKPAAPQIQPTQEMPKAQGLE